MKKQNAIEGGKIPITDPDEHDLLMSGVVLRQQYAEVQVQRRGKHLRAIATKIVDRSKSAPGNVKNPDDLPW